METVYLLTYHPIFYVFCIFTFQHFFNVSPEYDNNKYTQTLFWKAYFKPYQIMTHLLTKRALKRSNIIFTNSKFTRNAIKKAYPAFDPQVIYPPIDFERFSSCLTPNQEKIKF